MIKKIEIEVDTKDFSYVAVDKDGAVFGFVKKPIVGETSWRIGGRIGDGNENDYDNVDVINWQDCLVEL